MARELSQEAVLDFLCGAGGRAPNSALLRHFQRFLRDPRLGERQRRERRDRFKSIVNSLATVRPSAAGDASKDVVLRRRYRDLLDEDLRPEERREEGKAPPPRRDPGPGEAAKEGAAGAAGGCAARGGPCCECRRALRAASATPGTPGTPGRDPHPTRRDRSSPPPPTPQRPRAAPPIQSQPPRCPRASPPIQSQPPRCPRASPPIQSQPPEPGALPSQPPRCPRASPPIQSQPPRCPRAEPPTQSQPPDPGALPSRPPRCPRESPSGRCPLPPPAPAPTAQPPRPRAPPAARPLPSTQPVARPRSPPQPPAGMSPLKAPPPSAGPGGEHPTGASRSPRPPPSLPARSVPEVLPSARSLPLQGAPSLSRSLQALPAAPSPRLPSGPDAAPSARLLPAQSRSLQRLPTGPPRSPTRTPRVLTRNGPTQSQVLLLYPYPNPPPPSDPGVLPTARPPPSQSSPQSSVQPSPSPSLQLPPTRPPPYQSSPQSSIQPSPSRPLQPPPARPAPSQALLPAAGPRAPESSPPASLPVFRSIRCQLALLEEQGIPPSLPGNSGRQPRTVPSKSSLRNVPSRGLSVPLGQREHAWLVAVSEGRWARVRGLFQEEPELALQRDFMSGFTVLHWLAKHGDGPGLQELAAAARQAGLALDVDARSGCGYTPLHLAAIHGHQFVIKVLVLQLGCQVQVRDGSGRRPWEYLGGSTSGEIWQLLEAPPGTIMFPTEPLACGTSSVSKASMPPGKAALPACLRPHGRGAASHRTGNKSD